MNRVGVIGLGVVGGTIQRAFSEVGIEVRGYDRYTGVGRPTDLAGCPAVFLCVPTPSDADGTLRVSEVWSAIAEVEGFLEAETAVAIKSTVPPGTADRLAQSYPRLRFVSLPEFLVAARPLESFVKQDRIIVGAHSPDAAEVVAELMSRVSPGAPIVTIRPIEAELAKLCSNAMLAAKVTVANQLAEVCSSLGVDWSRVQGAVGLDRRIGPEHLTVTSEKGFAGACLPKDVDGLIAAAREAGCAPHVLEAIVAYNRWIRNEASVEEFVDLAGFEQQRARGA